MKECIWEEEKEEEEGETYLDIQVTFQSGRSTEDSYFLQRKT